MRFSERMGYKRGRDALQLEALDEALRVAVFNLLHAQIVQRWYAPGGGFGGAGNDIAGAVWTRFWHRPIDDLSRHGDEFNEYMKDFILSAQWFEVYDLLEFVVCQRGWEVPEAGVNAVLESEASGYRMRAGLVVPITDETELSAIDDALAAGDTFKGARVHIADALDKLSQRPEPDLRNAITEAISAVESAARVVSGNSKATLGDALKVLERSGHIHPCLRDAWLKLYGYTSDEHGLRHAMLEEPDLDFATTKYLVVSCAAFVNLLAARA